MSEQGWHPTLEEWCEIHDALAEVETRASAEADMWRGRSREERYRRESDAARMVRKKVAAVIDILDPPVAEGSR